MTECVAKILVVGEAGSGKTSLVSRYTDNLFDYTTCSTIGVDFRVKTLNGLAKVGISQSKAYDSVKLQIWDTAGQERFNAIVSSFYRNVSGIIIVFNLLDNESFEAVKTRWLPQLNNIVPATPLIVVGNKCELVNYPEELPLYSQALQFCREQHIPLVLASAKSGTGVDAIFESLVAEIIRLQVQYDNDHDQSWNSAIGNDELEINKNLKLEPLIVSYRALPIATPTSISISISPSTYPRYLLKNWCQC